MSIEPLVIILAPRSLCLCCSLSIRFRMDVMLLKGSWLGSVGGLSGGRCSGPETPSSKRVKNVCLVLCVKPAV